MQFIHEEFFAGGPTRARGVKVTTEVFTVGRDQSWRDFDRGMFEALWSAMGAQIIKQAAELAAADAKAPARGLGELYLKPGRGK